MQDFADTGGVAVLGYRYVSDQAFSDKQRDVILSTPSVKEVFNVMTEAEIRDIINNKMRNMESPVRIIFSDSVCVDCGEEGDPRLLSSWCHMEPCQVHPAPASPRHPGGVTRHHPTDRLTHTHPGHVTVGRCGVWCGCGPCARPRYSCCGRKENTEGCRQLLACCRNLPTSAGCQSRYSCCGVETSKSVKGCTNIYSCCGQVQADAGPGCRTVCKRCGQVWGSRADKCFRKQHNTVTKHQLSTAT